MYVSRVSIAINLVLSAFKLFAGVAAHSGAMISDGIHTASDVLSTLIVMAGVAMADRQSDKEHPYGHERMECVAAVLLAAVLFATGAGVGIEAVKTVVVQSAGGLAVPGRLALIAAVVSIVVKEWMYWYTRAAARKIDSQALMADAWHHRSDALSSVGALVGIAGARMGIAVLDPVASLVICIFIVKAAAGIFRDAVDRMVDKSAMTGRWRPCAGWRWRRNRFWASTISAPACSGRGFMWTLRFPRTRLCVWTRPTASPTRCTTPSRRNFPRSNTAWSM